MKKLIFRKFAKDTFFFFIFMSFTVGLIVWTMQAVNYFDYVTQDGHGLKTYFSYILFNFPKIIHRIIPFIFFISLFYMIVNYEKNNELIIFWTNGVSKLNFANKILTLSIFLTLLQILIGSFFSPYSQYKAREFIKNSNVDFFTSLIKEGKFINVVDGLTIFIDSKNEDGTYSNIFLDDSSKANSKMIYAKNGLLVDSNEKKIFKLFNGKVINKDKLKINVFEFDQIDFNLADYSSNSILVPKLQEINSFDLIYCTMNAKNSEVINIDEEFLCEKSLVKEINQELLKRFYKPLYIPIIALLCCFLIIFPKNSVVYEKNKRIIFMVIFFILVISEGSLRYSTLSSLTTFFYLILPWISFSLIYFYFFKKIKNV